MIKRYEGFKAEKNSTREMLPAGGYVVKILRAEVKSYDGRSGKIEKLEFIFDIAEGQYKDFFRKDYDSQQGEDKKWRGKFSIYIPKDDNNERDGWAKRTFNNFVFCIEDSNSGFHFDWDETKLKGKLIGAIYGNNEWEYNGKTGWSTQCRSFTTIGDVREGKIKLPKDKPLKEHATANIGTFAPIENDNEDELPF